MNKPSLVDFSVDALDDLTYVSSLLTFLVYSLDILYFRGRV